MQKSRIAFKSPPTSVFYRSALNVHFKQTLQSLRSWIVRSDVWMHPAAENGQRSNPEWEALLGCFLLLFLHVAGMFPLQIAVNIRPKLLQLISEGVEAHLRSPARETRRKTAIGGGIIDVGNRNRRCVAGKLGNVEHVGPGVSSSNENTVDGIAKAVYERAGAQAKIARIDFQYRGVNAAHHDIAIHLISESRSIPLRISLKSLSEARRGVIRLPDAGHDAHEREFIGVEGALGCHGELLFPGHWLHL